MNHVRLENETKYVNVISRSITHGISDGPLNQTITNNYLLLINNGLSFLRVFIIDKERIIPYYGVNNLLCGKSINELFHI